MYKVNLLPQVGDLIKYRYKIDRMISQGENWIIFCAIDQQMRQVAIKLEIYPEEETKICIESAILKILANSNHIPRFFSYGSHKNYKFMACELLGPNMIDLINYKKPYKFCLHSVLKFGIQAIETLQIVHNKGFIHRNIKPGNFLIGNTQGTFGTFYLIGFELCKKINKHRGVVAAPTNKANFGGTMTYASLNAHNLIELGRQDDLISLLYILVEFYNGMLPWSDVDELKIQSLKEYFHGRKLLEQLPKQFLEFESYILSLDYTTDPDYAYLISLLKLAAEENQIDLNAPFEWEDEINEERDRIIRHHINYALKVDWKIEQLENGKKQIEQEKQLDSTEKIHQLDKEINKQKQSVLSPFQLQLKLNSLNIIHRLQKKYEQIFTELDEKLQSNKNEQNKQLNNIAQPKKLSSHIHSVKSYHSNNELSDHNLNQSISCSPLHSTNCHRSNNNNQFDESQQDKFQSSSKLNSINFRPRANTIQELVSIIDALVGIDSNINHRTTESNLQFISQQQEDQNKLSEQLRNNLKQDDKQMNELKWDQFTENTNKESQNEQFESFDMMSQDELLSGILSPFDEQQESIKNQYNQQITITNKHENENENQSNLYSPLVFERSQSSSPIYSPIILTPKEQAQKVIPKTEIQLNPQILESQLLPLKQVIRYSPIKQLQQKNHSNNNNDKGRKMPKLLIQQSQELDSVPNSPQRYDIQEELIQWNISGGSNNSTQNNIRKQCEQEQDKQKQDGIEFLDDDGLILKDVDDINKLINQNEEKIQTNSQSQLNLEQQTSQILLNNTKLRQASGDHQQIQGIDIENETLAQYRFEEQIIQNQIDDNDILSPFAIPFNNDINKLNIISIQQSENNSLISIAHLNITQQTQQSIHNPVNISNQQNINIKIENSSPIILSQANTVQSLLQQNSQFSDEKDVNTNSDQQLLLNQTSNIINSPKSKKITQLSPLINIHNAWNNDDEVNLDNEQVSNNKNEKFNEQIKQFQSDQENEKQDVKQCDQNNNLSSKHNTQIIDQDNNTDIESKFNNHKSCCIIL